FSKEDAKELFDVISDNTNIEFDHPENIKDYIQHLLSGDIEDAYGENPNEAHSDRSQVGHTTQNGVGDLNYHFTQNNNCSITTPKKFKSIGIHGYKYLISVYLTDIIHMKTYRIYEVFALRFLHHIQKDGSYLNIARFGVLLKRSVKEEMSKENALKINDDLCIGDWIKIPDNTPTNTKFFL
ncbi:17526_t:CDS:2, partial [Gigaspora rosea]